MPNRLLRDWTNSDKVNSLTPQGEVFFTRLIMKADDFGCFWADGKRLKSNLFPLSDSIRETDILRWMAECQKAELIAVYDSGNKRYLQILEFNQRLRTKKSRFPKPDSNLRADDGQLTDTCRLEVEEEVEVEEETEVKVKDSRADFWANEESRLRPLPECLGIALADTGWVSRNKTNQEELTAFNDYLLKTGVESKTLLDYKRHFANLKLKSPDKLKGAIVKPITDWEKEASEYDKLKAK